MPHVGGFVGIFEDPWTGWHGSNPVAARESAELHPLKAL
jgi:hypothetical protein